MMKTSHKWNSKPGGWDALHLEKLYFEGDYPIIRANSLRSYTDLIPIHDNKNITKSCFVHTFVNDYLLERFWNSPERYIPKFLGCANVMSPDFSLLIGMPYPLLLYNLYRNRYVGHLWQLAGVNIIPTVSWSDEKSFDFCFEGIEIGATVAVSNIGCKTEKQKAFFDAGYNEMINRLQPEKIVFMCAKRLQQEYESDKVVFIESHFDKKRKTWAEELEQE